MMSSAAATTNEMKTPAKPYSAVFAVDKDKERLESRIEMYKGMKPTKPAITPAKIASTIALHALLHFSNVPDLITIPQNQAIFLSSAQKDRVLVKYITLNSEYGTYVSYWK